jgi:tetratricopeptide (TPR) repeat protein
MASDAMDERLLTALEQGRSLSDERRFPEALAVSDRLLAALRQGEYSPQLRGEAWGLRSVALLWLGRKQEALEAINQAIELDPRSTLAYVQRAATLRKMERYDEALQDADQAIALVPEVAGLWVERGRIFLGLNRTNEALVSFERALQCDIHDHEAWLCLIRALGDVGRFRDAIEASERGEQVFAERPNDRDDILLEHSYILYKIRRWDEVIALTDEIVSRDPANTAAWELHGSALGKAKRLDEALQAHQRAAALDPASVHLANNVSQTLYLLDRQQEALMSYDQTLQRVPDDVRTRELRAYVLARLIARGQLPARDPARDILELVQPSYWRAEARVLAQLGEYEHAIAACDEGFRRYPAAVSLLNYKLILLVYHFHRFGDALQVFRQGIRVIRTYGRSRIV